ncbi:folate-Biopterin Transporter (FBT) family [Achlya hypogyna]|uniref:Folate-Biopterin Transporter (FBT) family n=1 Tax=Achlya hypogyna TaxID=1202772 RepID=A0A1V9YLW4_ACHHY|nr:folate-Biopterin Transporter (FBT) family [Achlya hypogyna]
MLQHNDVADRTSLSIESKHEVYSGAWSPEAMDGALREGTPPVYTSPAIIALLAQYAAIGIVNGGLASIKYPVLTGYFKLEGNVLNSGSALMSLGWSLKVFFGLMTDCVPIGGQHRKPYIFLGWLGTATVLVVIALSPPGLPAPDAAATAHGSMLALLCAVACFLYILADVAQDALLVQYAQCEPLAVRGRLQSLVYAVRSVFMAGIAAVSGFCLNSKRMAGSFDWDIGISGFFWVLAVPAIANVGIAWLFLEDPARHRVPFRNYLQQLWGLAQKRVVGHVLIFSFFFGLFTASIGTTAAPYVALYWAKVDTLNAALLQVLAHMIFAAVLAVMGTHGTQWNWRYVLVVTTIAANAIDAAVHFLTVYDIVRNQWFYLGVPLTEELPKAINFVVCTFVIVELAEEGNEGVMYGLLTTVGNLPSVFGVLVTNVLDARLAYDKMRIREDATATRHAVAYSYAIMYATTLLGCLWVFLLPSQKVEVRELKLRGGNYPRVAITVTVAFVIILATSVTGTMASMFEATSCQPLAGGRGCPPGAPQWHLLGIALPTALATILGFFYWPRS